MTQSNSTPRFTRRHVLLAGSAMTAGALAFRFTSTESLAMTNQMTDDSDIDWANLSEAEWKNRLTSEEFRVLRKEGTERAGSSPLDKQYADGTYVCAGCALPLFSSKTKFNSGTGWPSFFDHLPGAVETKRDFKLIIPRTEYHCSRCGGHQGHVFNDGPEPTGLRYCNNGVALDFVPA